MYKLITTNRGNGLNRVNEDGSVTSIPTDPDNTDYANFKKEILADEAQLQDAEGDLMTPEQAKDYVKELP